MAQGVTIKDSGARQQFDTGSVRDIREGKGRFDLLPVLPLRRLARHFEAGAAKYGDNNWRLGQPLGRFYDSAFRHLLSYWEGQGEEDHLAGAIWNLVALMDTEARIHAGELPVELDDHPRREGLPL